MNRARDWLLGIRKDVAADEGVGVAEATAAAVTAYKAALNEAGVDANVNFSLSVVGDSDGDADADEAVLFLIYDCYADWYVLSRGGTAEVVAYYSYNYNAVCCEASLGDTVDLDLLKNAETREARSEILKGSTRRKKAREVYKVLKSSSDDLRYTLGVAYPAGELDKHGDYATADELEGAAWAFMASGQIAKAAPGVDHAVGSAGAGEVVESYIYRGPDWEIGDQVVKCGDWMLGVVWDDDTWTSIKKGERNGYSMQGTGKRRPVVDEEIAA